MMIYDNNHNIYIYIYRERERERECVSSLLSCFSLAFNFCCRFIGPYIDKFYFGGYFSD
jgi:hypothetical protein